MSKMTLKEIIEYEIKSYERDRDTAAKEATKQEIKQSCYNEFVGVLKAILDNIEQVKTNKEVANNDNR